jgi:hypothetical protein
MRQRPAIDLRKVRARQTAEKRLARGLRLPNRPQALKAASAPLDRTDRVQAAIFGPASLTAAAARQAAPRARRTTVWGIEGARLTASVPADAPEWLMNAVSSVGDVLGRQSTIDLGDSIAAEVSDNAVWLTVIAFEPEQVAQAIGAAVLAVAEQMAGRRVDEATAAAWLREARGRGVAHRVYDANTTLQAALKMVRGGR